MKKPIPKQAGRVQRQWSLAARLENRRIGGKHNVPKLRKLK